MFLRWSLGNEMSNLNFITDVTANNLFEYRWPPGSKTSEHYFLQEQVTEYLGIKSFKRKYPTCQRRAVEAEERDFLVEMRVVNVTQADLGLTAIPSTQVRTVTRGKTSFFFGAILRNKGASMSSVT